MRTIQIMNNELKLSDEVIGFIEKTVTPFGNSGKVDCPKRFIGRKVYLVVCKDECDRKTRKGK